MIVSILFLLPLLALLVVGGDAYVLARRVEQKVENRETYQGGWGLRNPGSCPQNYSTVCSSKTDINQLCCPTGNTCFGSYVGYCCPTAQDCGSYVNTFTACADPTANMYSGNGVYFCCAQGLTGVVPASGFAFCETNDVSVAVSLLATMVSQYGGTSVTPFGGYATTAVVTGTAVNAGAGVVTATAASNPTPTSSTTSPTSKSSSSSSFGFNLSTGALVGIVIAGVIVLAIALSIWRWCKAKVKDSISSMDQSHSARPSVMPAYIPTNVQIYEPAPTRLYGEDVYDPVRERHTAVSPMSPSPAYSEVNQHEVSEGRGMYDPVEVNQHEMSEGRGMYDPIEVHGVGSTRGRVEMG